MKSEDIMLMSLRVLYILVGAAWDQALARIRFHHGAKFALWNGSFCWCEPNQDWLVGFRNAFSEFGSILFWAGPSKERQCLRGGAEGSRFEAMGRDDR